MDCAIYINRIDRSLTGWPGAKTTITFGSIGLQTEREAQNGQDALCFPVTVGDK